MYSPLQRLLNVLHGWGPDRRKLRSLLLFQVFPKNLAMGILIDPGKSLLFALFLVCLLDLKLELDAFSLFFYLLFEAGDLALLRETFLFSAPHNIPHIEEPNTVVGVHIEIGP